MNKQNIFWRITLSLVVFSTFFVASQALAETTVIINSINSANHEVELKNITAEVINLSDWKIVQQNLPLGEQNLPISFDLSGSILASGVRVIPVNSFGADGAMFYLYDQLNNLVMSATISLDGTAPVISGVSPVSGSRVGGLTTLTFSSSEFRDPGCQVDGLNWGSPCNGSTFAAIPGWGNVPEGSFTMTIRDTDSAGNEGTLDVNYTKDVTSPTLVSAVADNATTIRLTFSENLQTNILTSDFMVSFNDFEDPIVSAVVQNNTIILTLQNFLLNTDIIALNINPFNPISIKDLVGNEFVPIETVSVTNNVPEVVVVETDSSSATPASSSSGGRTSGYSTISTQPSGQVLGVAVFRFNRNLSYGQKHPDVVELQKRLMKEGFLSSSTPTNYFGPQTLAAVKLYQKKNKLPILGYVGPMTRSVLNGWFVKNRPENQLASILEQIQNLQNLLNAMLGKTSR
jgi:hypothetical protein